MIHETLYRIPGLSGRSVARSGREKSRNPCIYVRLFSVAGLMRSLAMKSARLIKGMAFNPLSIPELD
jgi:hypothetical protein